MTTVSRIILDAYRQSNIVSINATLTPLQEEDGLRYLNRIVKSVYGFEAGELLEPFPIGGLHIQRPAGFPTAHEEALLTDWFVPANTRVMFNIDRSHNIWLNPTPEDGSRFAVTDASKNLDQFPVTVHGNGRLIEGQFTLDLAEAGMDAEWFYRAEEGNWVRVFPMTVEMEFPFPEEFDAFFITQLALNINPSYGMQIDPQTQSIYQRAAKQLRARYSQVIQTPSELGLIRLTKTARDRDAWKNYYWNTSTTQLFNKGWPW